MARSSFRSVSLCFVLANLALVGCSSSGPSAYPVSGKVSVDGQAVKNCAIHFQPLDKANQVASGQIADDGTYTLYTGTTGTPGAMPGKYKVVLQPVASANTSYKEGSGSEPPVGEPDIVPKEYMNASTTPKEVEVTTGRNTINIEIPSGSSAAPDSSADPE